MSVKLSIKEYKVWKKTSARCMTCKQKQIKIRCFKSFPVFHMGSCIFNIPIQFFRRLVHYFLKVFHCISVIFFSIVEPFLNFKNLDRKYWCFPLSKSIFGSLQKFPYYHSSFFRSVCPIIY